MEIGKTLYLKKFNVAEKEHFHEELKKFVKCFVNSTNVNQPHRLRVIVSKLLFIPMTFIIIVVLSEQNSDYLHVKT